MLRDPNESSACAGSVAVSSFFFGKRAAGPPSLSQGDWCDRNGRTAQPQMSVSCQILSEPGDLVSVIDILAGARKAPLSQLLVT